MTKKTINTAPKCIPILFNTEMVRAVLSGNKTQTRRIVKDDVDYFLNQVQGQPQLIDNVYIGIAGKQKVSIKLKIRKDDILWVRETFGQILSYDMICYKADCYNEEKPVLGWKPSIFMPKEACRLFLKVKNIRIERLQKINRGDAMAEGCPFPNLAKGENPVLWFTNLWKSINGKESWEANPFVWVIEFEKVERPQGFI